MFWQAGFWGDKFWQAGFWEGDAEKGGGGVSKGWANEMAILEASLKNPKPVVEAAPVVKKEVAGGADLLREAQEITRQTKALKRLLDVEIDRRAEIVAQIAKNNQALEVIFMALRLDKYVLLQIIT